jgi:hypothetical protein
VISLVVKSLFDRTFSNDHFGANILSTRDRLGDEGTYDEAVDFLGVGTIRYPGGSLTERYFDISDPDQLMVEHFITGAALELLPYSEFMSFAEETGRAVLVVLPTRTQLSEQSDSNGDRFAAVDEEVLRDFVRDTLDGFYGSPKIAGFEIGNEYWDSGQMTSVEYGRVASTMARIVKEELNSHPDFDIRFVDTKIHVQMGMDYGYAGLDNRYDGTAQDQLEQFMADYNLQLGEGFLSSSGKVAWPKIANLLIMREFDLLEEREAFDGVVAHVYSRGELNISSHSYELRLIAQTWGQEFDHVKPVVTEWNVRSPGRDPQTDFGLIQAGEMLDMVQAMGLYDVSAAYVWAVQQGSRSNLAGDEGDPVIKVGGAFFQMMAEALPGTRAIVLQGAGKRESEIALENAEVHAFAGGEKLVLYFQSTTSNDTHETTVDLSGLLTGFDNIKMTRLGVIEGDGVGSSKATPVSTELDPSEHHDNGILSVSLAPREIVQVTITGADFTPALSQAIALADQNEFGARALFTDEDVSLFSDGPMLEELAQHQENLAQQAEADMPPDDSDNDIGFSVDMLMMGLLLPVLMLAAAF